MCWKCTYLKVATGDSFYGIWPACSSSFVAQFVANLFKGRMSSKNCWLSQFDYKGHERLLKDPLLFLIRDSRKQKNGIENTWPVGCKRLPQQPFYVMRLAKSLKTATMPNSRNKIFSHTVVHHKRKFKAHKNPQFSCMYFGLKKSKCGLTKADKANDDGGSGGDGSCIKAPPPPPAAISAAAAALEEAVDEDDTTMAADEDVPCLDRRIMGLVCWPKFRGKVAAAKVAVLGGGGGCGTMSCLLVLECTSRTCW